jgi:glycosyltransferase involved in cell wall biosynthesis
MDPLISIIIPAHNAIETLHSTLQSVADQTFRSWKAIVVDDGSTDATPELIRSWCTSEPRISALRQTQSGVSTARNKGATAVSTPWLVFLDADDLISPNYLEVMLDAAATHPEVDLVCCGIQRSSPDGRLGPPELPPQNNYFDHLAGSCCFTMPASCVLKRSTFTDAGGFDTSLNGTEDWDLWQRLARAKCNFLPVSRVLAVYRMRANSLVRNFNRTFSDSVTIIERGHSVDPRVDNPAAEFAAGKSKTELNVAIFSLTLWVTGLAIGGGQDAAPILAEATRKLSAWPPNLPGEVAAVSLWDGLLVGACAIPTDWPSLWMKIEAGVSDLLQAIAHCWNATDLAQDCYRYLEGMAK